MAVDKAEVCAFHATHSPFLYECWASPVTFGVVVVDLLATVDPEVALFSAAETIEASPVASRVNEPQSSAVKVATASAKIERWANPPRSGLDREGRGRFLTPGPPWPNSISPNLRILIA
jgi:hypothetical protein